MAVFCSTSSLAALTASSLLSFSAFSSAFASAFEKFHGGGSKPVGEGKTAHANAITSLRLMGGQRFSTAALDGRLVVWDAGVANGVEQLAL